MSVVMAQCPMCHAFMPVSKMLVRGLPNQETLVCSASCGARLRDAQAHLVGEWSIDAAIDTQYNAVAGG